LGFLCERPGAGAAGGRERKGERAMDTKLDELIETLQRAQEAQALVQQYCLAFGSYPAKPEGSYYTDKEWQQFLSRVQIFMGINDNE
jgi:TorA maturation chaperone TorD